MKETAPSRRTGSLSLDLDNQWSYMKTHGDAGWTEYPSYLGWVVPRILEFLDRREHRITFFIVGQDAAIEENRDVLRSIAAAGHEIGNHSFRHEPWLHLYSDEELDSELAKAEEAIRDATGATPRGFRGPGFSLSDTTLRALIRRGYEYDATVFPNLLNPLARAYFFATSSLSAEEREQRKALFGTWRDALQPVKQFQWTLGNETLMELPVTTMPFFKTPIHLSYILYAAQFSRTLALAYFRMGLMMCSIAGVAPAMLLHPLDFIGHGEVDELDFFPGMRMPIEAKLDVVNRVLDMLQSHCELVTVREQIGTARPPFRRLTLEAS